MANDIAAEPNAHKTESRARRTNGATQTFRRPSHATSLSGSTAHSASRDAPAPPSASNSGVYVPPHAQPGRNGSLADGRFSRGQLTQLFRTQRDGDDLVDVASLSMGAWESHATNGVTGPSWGRNHDHSSRDVQSGVEQCWVRDGSIEPLSLHDLTDGEREVCHRLLLKCVPPCRLTCVFRSDFPVLCQLAAETANPEHQQGRYPQGGAVDTQGLHNPGWRHTLRSIVANHDPARRPPSRHERGLPLSAVAGDVAVRARRVEHSDASASFGASQNRLQRAHPQR